MKGIIAGVVLLVFAGMKLLAIRRARAAERRGGCVACGSVNIAVQADVLSCRDCGYEGGVDRGGQLNDAEIGSIFDRRNDDVT